MSEQVKTWLLLLGVLAVGAFLLMGTNLGSGQTVAEGGGITWAPGRPVTKQRRQVFADTMRHPLYRRPPACGHGRTCLIDYGWQWIASPPSEAAPL